MKRISLGTLLLCGGLLSASCTPETAGGAVKKPTPTPSASSPARPVSDKPLLEAVVYLRNNRFEPAELTIAQGGRVNFINMDNQFHSVTPLDGAKFMEVVSLAPGNPSGQVTFLSSGDHRFRCREHADMSGVVRVRYAPEAGLPGSAAPVAEASGSPAPATPSPTATASATPVPSPSASATAAPSS